jgi:hypothetical protein
MSMNWASFLYSQDAFVDVRLVDGHSLTSIDEVIIRPTTLNFNMELRDAQTVRVRVPYTESGQRFSVEFAHDLLTSYNDTTGISGQLSEDPAGAAIHTEPRNALLVFAEPMLEETELDALIPNPDNTSVYFPASGEIDYLHLVDSDVIYFAPGTYFMPWNYHAYLHENVRWVYLAPGAYVKGAFAFQGQQDSYRVTGYGVLSGEHYVYEADTITAFGHQAYTHRSDLANNCHGTCVKLLEFYSAQAAQHIHIHGITLTNPAYHSFVVYGDVASIQTDFAHYKQVGAWYWQTDGVELYPSGSLKHAFLHANDDVIKLYHSNVSVDDVVVWKGENGPVFQWGWAPRDIANVQVQNVDIIHNRMYWQDDKHNTCIFNSARHFADISADNTADSSALIRDMYFSNIRSEGMNLCAMRLYALANWQNIEIRDFSIDAWNALAPASQYSFLETLTDGAQGESVTISNENNLGQGLLLQNYQVNGETILKTSDNWSSEQLGRLNFSSEHWLKWDAVGQ